MVLVVLPLSMLVMMVVMTIMIMLLTPPPLGLERDAWSNGVMQATNEWAHWNLNQLIRRYPCASSPDERFLVGCRSPFVRLAEHLTTLCAWGKQRLRGR